MEKNKTDIRVTAIFDGELDATDVFVGLIAQRHQQISRQKKQQKDNKYLAISQDNVYNQEEVHKPPRCLDCAGKRL